MAAKRNDMFNFFDPSKAKGPRSGPDIGKESAPQPMSVSLLVARVKQALADAMPASVTVVGELSNVKCHDSGHVYFRLKDAKCAIDAVMFRGPAGKLKFTPADGLEVVVEGRVDVYDARGQLQLYVERMTPVGAGSLELAFRQLKEKLQAEGLFDAAAKKPIPRFPRAVGVITSQTGAAVRDISRTLRRRWPAAEVYLLPTLVQGEGAASQIAECIRLMDASSAALGIDTIIVGRGGGSLEDLWAFNEEAVARAVFAAGTPIISGVGHEVDFTICDLVADVRAATPTAAAELAVPDASAVGGWLSEAAARATRRMRQRLDEARLSLESICRSAVFRDPMGRVRAHMQRMDEFAHRLRGGIRHRVAQARRSAEMPAAGLAALHPARLCERGAAKVDGLLSRLRWALGGRSKRAGEALGGAAGRLAAASPVNRVRLARQQVDGAARQLDAMSHRGVLRRGFSVTRSQAGRILRSASQALAGEMIETELADGKLRSRVESDGEDAARSANECPNAPPGAAPARPGVAKRRSESGPTLF